MIIADFVTHLLEVNKYSCVQFYNLINEPHGSWSSIGGRFPEWKRAILNLAGEFERRKLHERMLIVAPAADQEWTHRTLEDKEYPQGHRHLRRTLVRYAGGSGEWQD